MVALERVGGWECVSKLSEVWQTVSEQGECVGSDQSVTEPPSQTGLAGDREL